MVEKVPSEEKERVLRLARERNVKFIRLWFTDLLGVPKNFAIPVEELERALQDGMWFDGSSIPGYQAIQESDMIAVPDPFTFRVLPWHPQEKATARMICDIYYPDGRPYECDPRGILRRNLEYLKQQHDYVFNVGAELEFFVFKNDVWPEVMDRGSYFDFTSLDQAADIRRQIILALEEFGMRVEHSHHEVAPAQQEITMRYADALTTADNVLTYRVVAKEIALRSECYVSFMPKPLYGENGSGMHIHVSLFKDGENLMWDPQDPYGISDIARKFTAGILRHVREFSLIIAQWVNSYKRLVPGYEAPAYIVWARANRSALVRVPWVRPEKKESVRLEFRGPDPACNPYLTISVLLRAGLKGLEENLTPPEPIEKDLYHMPEAQRKALGVQTLPETLGEAIKLAEKSPLIKEALGEKAFQHLLDLKRREWDEFRMQVTEWEIKKYFHIL